MITLKTQLTLKDCAVVIYDLNKLNLLLKVLFLFKNMMMFYTLTLKHF